MGRPVERFHETISRRKVHDNMVQSLFESLIDLQAASLAECHKGWQRMLNVTRIPDAIFRPREGATPHEVVFTKGTLRLLRYRRATPAIYTEPLLICYALVNRPYILDLQPDKSVVRQYLARGFDVYLIDWGAPTDADRELGLEDYVCGYLKVALDFIRSAHACEKLNLLGYCMGGRCPPCSRQSTPILLRTWRCSQPRSTLAAVSLSFIFGPNQNTSMSMRCWTRTATAPERSCRAVS
jgi:hypothetical protein